jgi:hypothetical protein
MLQINQLDTKYIHARGALGYRKFDDIVYAFGHYVAHAQLWYGICPNNS